MSTKSANRKFRGRDALIGATNESFRLVFVVSFSLVRFFWTSKRNEQVLCKLPQEILSCIKFIPMKKINLLAPALLISLAATAQKIEVKESNEKIGNGSNNALVVTIYEADPSDIEKEWRSLMKDFNAKTSTKDGVFADNATIKSFGGNGTVDVYAKTEKGKEKETKFIVAFDLGGAYLSSSQHAQQFKEAKKMVNDFALKMTKEAIAGQLKAAQKLLDKLNDNQKDLVDKKRDLEVDIDDFKNKIKKAEDEIAKNKDAQDKKLKEIEAQKKALEEITAKEKAVN